MDFKRIDGAIAAYRKRGDSALDARLGFFRSIWEIQGRFEDRAAEGGCPVPSSEDMKEWYWYGEPAFAKFPVRVDGSLLAEECAEVARCMASSGAFDEESSSLLSSCDWSSLVESSPLEKAGTDPAAYVEGCGEAAEEAMPGHGDLALMVLSMSLRSQLEPAAESYLALVAEDVAKEAAEHSKPLRCPCCGGVATASYVGPTPGSHGMGKVLWCQACGSSWEFDRVRCPHCGTRSQGSLHYTSLEGDDSRRIYHCDECGGYLRTRFVEPLDKEPMVFEVEDVVMVDLDLVAAQMLQDKQGEK